MLEPLGHQHDGRGLGDLALEELENPLFAHAVDGVDGVARRVPVDPGEVLFRGRLAGPHHGVAHVGVDAPDRIEEPFGVAHAFL